AGGRIQQAGHAADGGALAAAVRSQKSEHGSGGHREGEVFHADGGAVILHQTIHLDGIHAIQSLPSTTARSRSRLGPSVAAAARNENTYTATPNAAGANAIHQFSGWNGAGQRRCSSRGPNSKVSIPPITRMLPNRERSLPRLLW